MVVMQANQRAHADERADEALHQNPNTYITTGTINSSTYSCFTKRYTINNTCKYLQGKKTACKIETRATGGNTVGTRRRTYYIISTWYQVH